MHRFIEREARETVTDRLRQFPVVAILGPRQCGKSTLARTVLSEYPQSVLLDLELPSDLAKLTEPELFLRANMNQLVCLDEIQRTPDLFPVIRALVDEDPRPGRFLILGSASPSLLRQSTETLAGRIAFVDLSPLTLTEVGAADLQTIWMRGGFPRSYLAATEEQSAIWCQQFVRTFLEGDLPAMGIDLSTPAVRRLWQMLASGSGSILNRSKLADPVGVSPQSISRYIGILEATFMVRVLRPYFANVKKRLVKSPKVYVRDSGLLHSLLGITSTPQLVGNISVGASWESFAVEQMCSALPGWTPSFYRTGGGAELDLILERSDQRIAVEAKASTAPRVGRGFHDAAEDISATRKYVVAPLLHPGSYPGPRDTIIASPDRVIADLRALTPT